MMAEAILQGLLSKKIVQPEQITVCELLEQRRKLIAEKGVYVTADGCEMLRRSTVVIIAVKPHIVPMILPAVSKHEKDYPENPQLFISICAGVTLSTLQSGNSSRKCVRVMPNQPCLVGEAASAFTMSETCVDRDGKVVDLLLGACGFAVQLPERNLDAVTGLSGSGPAFVFMMIEAMADGGVRKGLPRAVARHLAAQTVLGAAKMTLDFPDLHPAELRNRVESPSGTTIAGTAALEEGGFRSAVINAVSRATERSEELGGLR